MVALTAKHLEICRLNYAKTDVDMLVSTAMYRAKICDIKAEFTRL